MASSRLVEYERENNRLFRALVDQKEFRDVVDLVEDRKAMLIIPQSVSLEDMSSSISHSLLQTHVVMCVCERIVQREHPLASSSSSSQSSSSVPPPPFSSCTPSPPSSFPAQQVMFCTLNGVRGYFSEGFDSISLLAGPPSEEEALEFFKDPGTLFGPGSVFDRTPTLQPYARFQILRRAEIHLRTTSIPMILVSDPLWYEGCPWINDRISSSTSASSVLLSSIPPSALPSPSPSPSTSLLLPQSSPSAPHVSKFSQQLASSLKSAGNTPTPGLGTSPGRMSPNWPMSASFAASSSSWGSRSLSGSHSSSFLASAMHADDNADNNNDSSQPISIPGSMSVSSSVAMSPVSDMANTMPSSMMSSQQSSSVDPVTKRIRSVLDNLFAAPSSEDADRLHSSLFPEHQSQPESDEFAADVDKHIQGGELPDALLRHNRSASMPSSSSSSDLMSPLSSDSASSQSAHQNFSSSSSHYRSSSSSVASSSSSSPSSLSSSSVPPSTEPKPTYSFHDFAEKMRHPSALPFVKSIKKFIETETTVEGVINTEESSSRMMAFVETTLTQMQSTPLWRNASAEEMENTREGIERYVLIKLYSKVFAPTDADLKTDAELSRRLSILQLLSPKQLDVDGRVLNDPSWPLATNELLKINNYKAPVDKLKCISNACRLIFGILGRATPDKPSSTDDFLPVLIFLVLRANPPHLHSNIKFIQEFRHPNKLMSETGFFYTNLYSAAMFLQTANAQSFNMSQKEFDKLFSSQPPPSSDASKDLKSPTTKKSGGLFSRAKKEPPAPVAPAPVPTPPSKSSSSSVSIVSRPSASSSSSLSASMAPPPPVVPKPEDGPIEIFPLPLPVGYGKKLSENGAGPTPPSSSSINSPPPVSSPVPAHVANAQIPAPAAIAAPSKPSPSRASPSSSNSTTREVHSLLSAWATRPQRSEARKFYNTSPQELRVGQVTELLHAYRELCDSEASIISIIQRLPNDTPRQNEEQQTSPTPSPQSSALAASEEAQHGGSMSKNNSFASISSMQEKSSSSDSLASRDASPIFSQSFSGKTSPQAHVHDMIVQRLQNEFPI